MTISINLIVTIISMLPLPIYSVLVIVSSVSNNNNIATIRMIINLIITNSILINITIIISITIMDSITIMSDITITNTIILLAL